MAEPFRSSAKRSKSTRRKISEPGYDPPARFPAATGKVFASVIKVPLAKEKNNEHGQ